MRPNRSRTGVLMHSRRPGVSDFSAAASAAITDCFVHSFRFKLARGVGRFCEATGGLAGRSRLQHPAPGGPAAARPEPDAASDLSWPPTQAAASSRRAPPACAPPGSLRRHVRAPLAGCGRVRSGLLLGRSLGP